MTNTPVVGMVGPSPPPNGGMALQTRQLCRLLREEGLQVEFLSSTPPWRPALVGRVPVVRALWRLLPYLARAWSLAGRVDVIHLMANSGWSWQLFAAPVLWLSSWRGTPVIVNYRGGAADEYFASSIERVRPSMDRAGAIVVPSMFLKEVFGRYGMDTRIVPNVVDRTLFYPAPDNSSRQGALTIAITRNLEKIYGIDTALEAFAQVLASEPGARLRIAGSGPELQALQGQAEALGVAHAVVFEGRMEREAVAQLYRSAHILLNPTTVDNMPASVIEAMASGTAVVSTAVGGVPFILRHEDTGMLVPSGDAGAMAEAILRLHGDPDLVARLAGNALDDVQQYSWDSVREGWLNLYRQLGQGGQGSEPA